MNEGETSVYKDRENNCLLLGLVPWESVSDLHDKLKKQPDSNVLWHIMGGSGQGQISNGPLLTRLWHLREHVTWVKS